MNRPAELTNQEAALEIRFGPVDMAQVRIRSTDPGIIVDELTGRVATAPKFFQRTAVCLDLSELGRDPDAAELRGVVEAVRRAGMLPVGLVNAVTGLPEAIGATLTTHRDVAKIAFTGGASSAARIGAQSSQTVKSVTLELGGNDPAILLPGTTPDTAMLSALRRSVFMNTGQVCMAIKRIYVHENDAAAFVRDFSDCVDGLVVGNGLEPHVTMGPLHSQAALDRSRAFINDAQARGATIRPLGTIDDNDSFGRGYFMRPTLVTDIADDAPLMAEEQFCPALPIATYHDLDDAIVRANHTDFGLSASVWGLDLDKAAAVASQIEAGAVFINGHGVASLDRRMPYGGLKRSGQGRKAAREGILEYCQSQVMTVIA